MNRRALLLLAAIVTLHAGRAAAQQVISPAEHLGHPIGADFKLPGWKEVSAYYRLLADQSPRVDLHVVGQTTEGRDFLVAVISSEENLSRLNEIKHMNRVIADPRGRSADERRLALDRGRVVVFITPTMHSTEVAGTQMGMEFAWRLATSNDEPWRTARQTAVIVLTPTLNPDGLDHVSSWYHRTVHTPHEGAGLPKLYQFYTGHDNNRDWFMLTQVETRLLSRLIYQEWLPQILWDVHQQGNSEERLFIPPYRDPLNPNIDPLIVGAVNAIGHRAILDMTREGFTGIATGVSYDNWFIGGNRTTPARHNIIGILTEAASANYASPVFQPVSSLKSPLGAAKYDRSNQFIAPWPGGWWRQRDIIDYELAFGRSLLASINREPRLWLRNAMEAAERSIQRAGEASPGWLIPSDNADTSAVRRLVEALLGTGVEIHVSRQPLRDGGHTYPAGTIVIRSDQPYGGYVKDLFELQEFPAGDRPYDTCGWTLPLLMGVRRVQAVEPLPRELTFVRSSDEALAGFPGDVRAKESSGRLLASRDGHSWTQVVEELASGRAVRLMTRGAERGLWTRLPAGAEPSRDDDGLTIERLPRIGVYAPWSGSMDEGWLRWTLDHFRIPYTTVRNETIRAGRLGDILDVLVIPNVTARTLDEGRAAGSAPHEFVGGLAPEGAAAVQEFVRGGGRLVAWDGAASWAIDLFRLPLVEVTGEPAARGFTCLGSVLRGEVHEHRLTSGLPHDIAVFFDRSLAWREMTKAENEKSNRQAATITTLLRYAPNRVLLSGRIDKPEVIEGQAAWITTKHGAGSLHLLGFSPHFRGWTQQTMHLLFRAMLLP